ncbi:site-specific integrase [uncultured Vagococcus sp.]|uniref:tyrosine-type recombinase/integrase n=1 Tax=uncultured Vagococcus sp. TaxID=189676 RepID=UPI0028D302D8|nr:site-specific integrase [uncultured Vagococcus sp.]
MAVIKKYTKKDGSIAYMFNAYLGIDPETGKSKRTTRRGFRTQKEAKIAMSRLELEVDSGGLVKQSYKTFEEVYEVWYEQYKNTVKPVTADQTKRYFRLHILPKLGDMKIASITKFTCQKAVNEWSEEYSAFHLIKSIAQKMLNYAVSHDIIETNPMQFVIMPKRVPKKQEKVMFLELDQLKYFLIRAKELLLYHDYLIFRVLAFTGLRKGELAALFWSDFDEINQTISVSKTAGVLNKKNVHIYS